MTEVGSAGTTSRVTDNGPSDSILTQYGRVVKLDEDGDIEWEVQDTAFYSLFSSNSYLSGVVESPTGSIYAAGYCEHPTNGVRRSYGWLVKITADGCIDTLCTTTSLLEQIEKMNTSVIAYPNPTTDYLIFDIKDTHEELQIALFHLHGRLLQLQDSRSGTHVMMLNENLKSPGLYVWRVMTESGRILGSGKFVVGRE